MSLEEEMQRGVRAKQILNDPLYIEVMDSLKADIVSRIEQADFRDDQSQARLVLTLQLMKAFRRKFEAVLETGQMAETQLEKLKRKFTQRREA